MNDLRDPKLIAVLTRKQIDSLNDKIQIVKDEYQSKIKKLEDEIDKIQASCEHVWRRAEEKYPDRDPGEAPTYEHQCEACDLIIESGSRNPLTYL